MTTDIILHQWEASPFCRKAGRALDFKGLSYQKVDYNGLRGFQARRLSAVGKLPVVDIDGQRLQDSSTIARYLDAHYVDAPMLYPAEPQERALAGLWEDWADELLYMYDIYFRVMDKQALDQFVALMCEGRPAREKPIFKNMLKVAGRATLMAQGLGRMSRADVEAEFGHLLDRLEVVLTDADWLVGKAQTIADIAVGSQLLEIRRTSPGYLGLEQRPRFADWLARVDAA